MPGAARDRGSVCQPRGACGGHRSRGHERSAEARDETAGPGYAGIKAASDWLSGARPGRCRWHRPAGPASGPAAVRSSAGGQGGDAPRVRPRRKGRPAQLASKAAWFQSHLATSVNPCPGLACPVRIAPRIPPWRVRPTGDPNRFASIPAATYYYSAGSIAVENTNDAGEVACNKPEAQAKGIERYVLSFNKPEAQANCIERYVLSNALRLRFRLVSPVPAHSDGKSGAPIQRCGVSELSGSAIVAARRTGYPWTEQMSRKMLRNVEKRGVHTARNGPSPPPTPAGGPVAKPELSTADRLGSREGSRRAGPPQGRGVSC